MARHEIPQPHPSRLTPFAGHPGVVGIVPGQPELVVLTAIVWARAVGNAPLYFAYVDPMRYVVEEFPDGSVRHADVDPDVGGEAWQQHQVAINSFLHQQLDGTDVPWQFRYLAGRADRALTHLARAVDAAVIIVGTHAPGMRASIHEFVEGSVAVHLAHHQHRPVLVVPLTVVDWKEQIAWG